MANKKTIFTFLAAAVLFALLSQPAAAALSAVSSVGSTTTAREGDFCSRLSTYNSTMATRMAEKEAKLAEARAQRDADILARQAERETKLAESRAKWDINRAEKYNQLLGRTKTDEQKAAVAVFQGSVEQAVTVRRAAIDSAINNFRDGVKEVIDTRKVSIDVALATLKASIKAAEDKAAADCSAGVAPTTVRSNTVASVQAAREKFTADRQAAEKISEKVKQLNETRKLAFEKAMADFKAAVEQAKAVLKTAFAKPAVSSATSTDGTEPGADGAGDAI